MYEWSNDKELIEIELGKKDRVISIDDFKNDMSYYMV